MINEETRACGCGMREPVGQITEAERDEIQALFERKNGLSELCRTLSTMTAVELETSPFYDKLVRDMAQTTSRFQVWWSETARRYQWKGVEGGRWEVDFDTCTVYLVS